MTTDTVGGVWHYALQLAGSLHEHGVEVALATMGAPLSLQQRVAAEQIPSLRIFESLFKLEWMEQPWDDLRQAGQWLLELEETLSPDIVHLNGYVHGALPWKSPLLVVGHSCVLSWWEAVRGETAPADWTRYKEEVASGLQAADIVVAPTRAMLNSLAAHYGPFKRSRVIYNGRAAEAFTPGIKEPFVLSAGRLWDEAKNVRTLSDVASTLSWPVYVAGEERHPSFDNGTDSGPDSGPGNHARMRGVQTLGYLHEAQLAGWLERASIYALPARYEPFGLSALEAALAGCALVLGDIPSLREVWGDTALYVGPDDSSALQSTLEEFISDPLKREEYSRRAQRRAALYTPERTAQRYLKVYNDLRGAGEMRAGETRRVHSCAS